MLFLIEYDRSTGRLVRLEPFAAAARTRAEDERLDLELALDRQGIEREVVVLEAEDEQALRRTHRRYFEDLVGIASSSSDDTV